MCKRELLILKRLAKLIQVAGLATVSVCDATPKASITDAPDKGKQRGVDRQKDVAPTPGNCNKLFCANN